MYCGSEKVTRYQPKQINNLMGTCISLAWRTSMVTEPLHQARTEKPSEDQTVYNESSVEELAQQRKKLTP